MLPDRLGTSGNPVFIKPAWLVSGLNPHGQISAAIIFYHSQPIAAFILIILWSVFEILTDFIGYLWQILWFLTGLVDPPQSCNSNHAQEFFNHSEQLKQSSVIHTMSVMSITVIGYSEIRLLQSLINLIFRLSQNYPQLHRYPLILNISLILSLLWDVKKLFN